MQHYTHDPDDPHSLSHAFVRAFLEDRHGHLWVGTHGGLNQFIPSKPEGANPAQPGRFTAYTKETHASRGFTGTTVGALLEDRVDGKIWVGTWQRGLFRLDPRTETFKHFAADEADPHALLNHGVMTLAQDHTGTLWVGTWVGLHKYDRQHERFTRYYRSARGADTTIHLSAISIYSLYEAPSLPGVLWIGTVGGGLNRFDVLNNHITYFLHDPDDPHSLGGNDVYALHEDADGTLWVGTNGGLNRMDRTRGRFTRYTMRDGLPNNTVRCIVEDHRGRLWLGTRNGLSRFDKAAETFTNYDTHDGLQDNEHSWTGCLVSRRGTLLLGGRNGYTEVHPDSLGNHPSAAPQVALTDFQLFGTSIQPGAAEAEALMAEHDVVLPRAITQAETLTLSYKASVFSLGFAALHFANLSHEFRTPLTLIRGPVEDLRAGHHGPLSEAVLAHLDLSLRNTQRLGRLIDQLLDLARLEAGKLRLEAACGDLVVFLRRVVSAFASLAERQRIDLHFEGETSEIALFFDRDKLETVVTNLLSNAFKFTEEGGRITVAVEDAPPEAEEAGTGAFVTLRVEDTGAGIAPEALPHLFDRFYQADGTMTRRHEGTGIGLALVKELVELHGGEVRVESEAGRGTAFTVLLPRGADHLSEEEIVLERERGGKGERGKGREEDRRSRIEDCADGWNIRSGPGCLPDGCASIRRS